MSTQNIYVEGGSVEINGNSVEVEIKYSADDTTLTGLGLRIHYDSSALTLAEISNMITSDQIDGDATPAADVDNLDGNAATDSYVDFAWASLFGNWPGSSPVDLLTAKFDVADGVESSVIGFSASSVAAGYTLNAPEIPVAAPQPPLVVTPNPTNIDENAEEGQVVAQAVSGLANATFSLTDPNAGGDSAESEVVIPELSGSNQQLVYVSESTKSEDGTQETVVISYNSNDTTVTGLGINIYFDSSAVTLSDIANVFGTGLFSPPSLPATDDVSNTDGDAATDKYVSVSYMDLFGSWPNSALAQELMTLTFDIADGATGTSPINFTLNSGAAGFEFVGQSHELLLSAEPEDTGESLFSIDSQSGAIKFNATADYETQDEYGFTVYASGSDGQTASVQNVLHINDVDETAPELSVSFSPEYIWTGAGDEVIATASATDADDTGAASSGVTLSLQNASADLELDAVTGEVRIVADVANVASAYTFDVVATDAAGNTASQSVSMGVLTDIDAPVITSGDTADAIDENSGEDQVVYNATATDANSFTWSLSDNSDPALSIDAATGAVTLSANPDAEAQSSYNFTVVATDEFGNVADQSVSLSINNLDEVAPTISSSDTADSILENTGAGQIIYTATADDSQDISAGVTFSLAEGSDPALSIDVNTGEVTLSDDPDFEAQDSYSFTVVASDGVNGVVSKSVTLDIGDEPDFKPIFESPATGSFEENIGENSVIHTVVARPDGGGDSIVEAALSPIVYSLEEGSDPALSIDASTGEVTLAYDPDYEDFAGEGNTDASTPALQFTVIATDQAENSSTQAISLDILNLDEIAPSITSGDTADAIDENSDADQVIYTATADDSLDISAGVTFSLSGDSDAALSIDENSGAVTLSDNPDHEAQSSYSFTVVASDGVNEDVMQSVTLDINDLDDAAPYVDSGDYAEAINENSGAGQVIYTATASDDLDDVADGPITFSLSDDSDSALSIDADTGEVTLSDDPDHETQESYTFTVIATDGADNVDVQQAQTVTLDIIDLDDTAPVITSSAVADAIDENSGAGQIVYTASSDDSADVSFGPVAYSLTDDSDAALSIDSATGNVTLADDPNFEGQSSYEFTVVATDADGNASSKSVTLSVNNLDDTAPIIEGTEVALTLSSFSGANQTVYAPANDSSLDFETAYDDSSDVTSEPLTFAISFDEDNAQYANDFAIDAATGVVTYLPDPFTEQETESIFYTVTATDGAGNSSSVDLQTIISGKEFNAPLFNYEFVTDESGERALDAEGQYILQSISVEAGYQAEDNADIIQNEGTEYEKSYDVVTAVSGSLDASTQSGDVIYTAVVADATPVKFSIADAVVVGENTGHNQGVYSAVASGHLSIDENTGEVSINGVPWSEGTQEYSFIVTATDSSDNSSEQLVTLDVSDYAVAPEAADVSYSLAEGHDEALSITDAGLVVLLEDPDFEAASRYSFVVEINDGNSVREQAVTLDVANTDDVAPTVTSGAEADAIDENSGAGIVVYTATADDSVDGSGSVVFALTDDSDPAMSIDAQTGAVTLAINPDHETQSAYSFTVVASDEAGNQSAGQTVTLAVNDVDETRPVITSESQASIDENLGAGQVIYTASSRDAVNLVERGPISIDFVQSDEGTLTLKLSIEESLASSISDGLQGIQFALNYSAEEHGVLEVDSIEYPSVPWMEVTNQTDGGISFVLTYLPPDLVDLLNQDSDGLYDASGDIAIAEISFNVGDTSANAEFSVGDVAITEYGYPVSHPAGESVYEYAMGDYGQTTYSLANDSDSALSIDENTGEVTLSGDADYEAQSEYNFTVVATDSSNNSTEESVTVSVNNLDEVAPTVTSSDSARSIDENSGAGQVIYSASADDSADVSDGFTFSLSADSDSALSIDAQTGDVTLSDNPDYEAQEDYTFTVIATDAAGNESEGQTVTLSVDNLDELAPVFTSDDSASVVENGAVGTVVYTAVADDSADISRGFKFSLSADSDPALTINPGSGKVSLLASADYEEQSEYSFTVIATDRAGNSSEQEVTLNVENLDEVAPVITSEVKLSVFENVGAGYVVYRASADDSADHSDGVTYSLSGSSDSALSIDEVTGAVTLAHDPDFETQDSYSFTIIATDEAGHVSNGHKVELTVDNLDEVAPTITSSDSASLSENSGVQKVIYTATADDSGDISGGVTFSLSEGSDAGLQIDAETGEVTLVHDADYEAKSSYNFTLVATDAAGNSSEKSVSVSVDSLTHVDVAYWNGGIGIADANVVVDGNLVGQTDAEGAKSLELAVENSVAVDKSVSSSDARAIDVADALAALRLSAGRYVSEEDTYYQAKAADIDGDGEVDITDALAILKYAAGMGGDLGEWVFEPNPQFTPHDSDTFEFTGYLVGDVDGSWSNTAPVVSKEVTINMDEGAAAGSKVFRYDGRAMELIAIDDGLVSLGGKSGQIRLGEELDYETKDQYTFTLRDKATGDQYVYTLEVGNVDESTPEFVSETAVEVSHDLGENKVIYTAAANDRDDTSVGVKYSLSEDSDPALTINARTGDVTLNAKTDHNVQSEYYFTVIANDGVTEAAQQQVVVSVLPEGDKEAPVITSASENSINEDVVAGDVVYTAEANEDVTFSLTRNSDRGVKIDAETGEVSLRRDANYEAQSEYGFTVVATDAAGNASLQHVTLNVNNLDEVAPDLGAPRKLVVEENSGAGQVLFTAEADDSADISGGVTFSLIDNDEAISINAETGVVTLVENPDYEAQSFYSFAVVATDAAGNASSQQVKVKVKNVDDIAPTITSVDTAVSIDENVRPGKVVYIATADDSADRGQVKFTLADGSDSALVINSNTGRIRLAERPDYEEQSEYSFTVVATDANGNETVGETVTLSVNNLDEIAPSITSGADAGSVAENSGADQVIYTATADDSADISGGVTFSLSNRSDNGLSIDEQTGAVTLEVDPDHERQSEYSFAVIATDAAGNSSIEKVTLSVDDLDEVAPELTSGDSASVVENSGAGQVVYTATADDSADTSDGVTFSLTGADDALEIDASTGEVTLNVDPNYEDQSSYEFTVVATDAVGNSSEKSVTISVENGDEAGPAIISGPTAEAIDENTGHNQLIYQVVAEDNADIKGGKLTYSLADGHDEAIAINRNTGEVFLLSNPDFEAQSSYTFTVIATDKAGHSGQQEVSLSVNNLDEVAPAVTSSDAAIAVDENSGADQVVYTATADDSADISGGVTFSLAEGSDVAVSIDAESGEVTLADNPNYESQSEYNFTVVATDAADNATEKSVTLSINNQDESGPAITSGSDGIAVDENTGAGQVVYTATADDSGDHSDGVTFSLVGDHDGFTIDANTGVVTTTDEFAADYEDQAEYGLIIVATDAAGHSSNGQPVSIAINNVDDSAPVVISADGASIVENSGAGQVVYTAVAEDNNDDIVSEPMAYSLAAGSDAALTIDSATGEVTLSDNPDYEAQSDYSFTVVATDGAGNSAEQQVSLTVANTDELAPSISSGDTAAAIDENSGAGQVIYTATASDDNNDVTSDPVTYSLADGSDPAVTINDETGEVTLVENPVHAMQSAYNFTVVATDAAGNSSEQSVSLAVNSVLPAVEITAPDAVGSLVENSGADQVIADAETNLGDDAVSYSLSLFSDDALAIDEQTGVVTLTDNPDYEAQSSYSFTILAEDEAGNVAAKVYNLSVNNLDEVAPTISSDYAADAIDENSGAGQVVYTATADDSADISAGVSFSLAEGSDPAFSIDSATGEVTLATDPDHEAQSNYSFIVVASDGVQESSKTVTVDVNNLDEAAPTITSGDSVGSIDENSGAGQVVYVATADDSADISEGVSYSLAGTDADAFTIDADSGAVSLTANPDYEDQSSYSFTVIATDAAGNSSDQELTLNINDLDENAPQFSSADSGSADENSVVIYTANASDAGAVSYSLTAGSDAALSIDADTGEVSVAGGANYEAQSEYVFAVIATDDSGNAAQQAVTVTINNLDEVAPQITSTDFVGIKEGSTNFAYTATADDSADVSDGVSYSLSDDNAGVFSIDSETGVVTMTGEASLPGYNFTVVASDGVNSSDQQVEVGVAELVNGVAPSAIQAGDVEQRFTQNADGSITLQLVIAQAMAAEYATGIENLDFTLKYTPSDIAGGQVTVNGAPSGPIMNIVNEDVSGEAAVGQLYFPAAFDVSSGLPIMEVTFDLAEGVSSTSFTVTGVIFGTDDRTDSEYQLDIATHVGTDASDAYALEDGMANIQSGAGSDVFVATADVDSSVLIDIESGADSIEMGQLLASIGYTEEDSVSQVSGDTPNIADLIAGNDGSLDNAFGAYLDDGSNILTLFVDNDTSAGGVDMQTYEVTVGEGLTVEDEDLSVTLSAFIA